MVRNCVPDCGSSFFGTKHSSALLQLDGTTPFFHTFFNSCQRIKKQLFAFLVNHVWDTTQELNQISPFHYITTSLVFRSYHSVFHGSHRFPGGKDMYLQIMVFCILCSDSVCYLSLPHFAYSVCLQTGCPGLQREDISTTSSDGFQQSRDVSVHPTVGGPTVNMMFFHCVVGFQLFDISELPYSDYSFPGCTSDPKPE